jgi:hypothetical protein
MDAQLIKSIGYEYYNKGDKYFDEFEIDIERHNPKLLEMISVLGEDKASGTYSMFKLVCIPDKYYTIVKHDSYETVYYSSYPFDKHIG